MQVCARIRTIFGKDAFTAQPFGSTANVNPFAAHSQKTASHALGQAKHGATLSLKESSIGSSSIVCQPRIKMTAASVRSTKGPTWPNSVAWPPAVFSPVTDQLQHWLLITHANERPSNVLKQRQLPLVEYRNRWGPNICRSGCSTRWSTGVGEPSCDD